MHSEEYYLFPRPPKLYGFGPRLRTNQECYLPVAGGTGDRTELLRVTSAERFHLGSADSSLCTGTHALLSNPSKTLNGRNTRMSCLLTDPVATEGTVI